jgi:hypothetical protein
MGVHHTGDEHVRHAPTLGRVFGVHDGVRDLMLPDSIPAG